MVLNTVDRQGDHLDASLLELPAVLGGAAELSGADGREVLRVGEQDAPSAEGDGASGASVGKRALRLVELLRLRFMIWPRSQSKAKGRAFVQHGAKPAQRENDMALNLHTGRTTDVMTSNKEEIIATFSQGYVLKQQLHHSAKI